MEQNIQKCLKRKHKVNVIFMPFASLCTLVRQLYVWLGPEKVSTRLLFSEGFKSNYTLDNCLISHLYLDVTLNTDKTTTLL